MPNEIAAVLLGAVIGAVVTTLVLRHKVTATPRALALGVLAVSAVVVAVELALAGRESAQRVWAFFFVSGAIVSAAVNLSTTRKRVETH